MRGISLCSSHVVDLSHIGFGSNFSFFVGSLPCDRDFFLEPAVDVGLGFVHVRLKQWYLHVLQIALASVTARTVARF